MIWNSVLIVMVIATAIALGVVIGWRRAATPTTGVRGKNAVTSGNASPATVPVANPSDASKGAAAGVSITPAKPASAGVPAGGLVVTENGKVVYRSSGNASSASVKAERPLVHRVDPEYPADARAQHVQGSVVLDVQVFNTGDVGNIGVVSGDPLLTQAAVDAVKQWRYQPDTVDAAGTASQTRVTVKFTLPPS
jgi:protein TonB